MEGKRRRLVKGGFRLPLSSSSSSSASSSSESDRPSPKPAKKRKASASAASREGKKEQLQPQKRKKQAKGQAKLAFKRSASQASRWKSSLFDRLAPAPLPSSAASSSSSSSSSSSAAAAVSAPAPQRQGLWVERNAPKTVDELCVHARKLKDVRGWLESSLGRLADGDEWAPRMLMLTGPSGCGKSAMVRVLARSLGLSLVEWEEQADGVRRGAAPGYERGEPLVHFDSRAEAFRKFLLKAKKYGTLRGDAGAGARRHLVLVEEFPYVGDPERRAQFSETVLRALPGTQSVLVFCVSDKSEGTDDVRSFFTDDVEQHPLVTRIKCNPVSATAMRKALGRVLGAEGVSLGRAELDALVDSSRGDLRSAINAAQFHFVAPSSSAKRATKRKRASSSSSSSSSKKGSKKDSAPSLYGRDSGYSLFRTLGKILHGKREVPPEEVVERGEVEPLPFAQFLHHNFHDHIPQDGDALDATVDALELMSQADVLAKASGRRFGDSTSAVPEAYAASVSARAFMLARDRAVAACGGAPPKGRMTAHAAPLSDRASRAALALRGMARAAFVCSGPLPGSSVLGASAPAVSLPYAAAIAGAQDDPRRVLDGDAQIRALFLLCEYSPPGPRARDLAERFRGLGAMSVSSSSRFSRAAAAEADEERRRAEFLRAVAASAAVLEDDDIVDDDDDDDDDDDEDEEKEARQQQ